MRSFPDQLSGGEQQRVAIARAIVNNPKVLIADEPTGNLDPEISWEIMQLLERINLQGTTVLMATHNKQIVDNLRHRVIAIEEGRMYVMKRKENTDIMIRNFFRHLWESIKFKTKHLDDHCISQLSCDYIDTCWYFCSCAFER